MVDKIVKPPLSLANKILKITEEVQYIKKMALIHFTNTTL